MRNHIAFCVLLIPLLGCGSDSPTDPGPFGDLDFTTLAATKVSGSAGPQIRKVVRDAADWSLTWSELWAGQPPEEPAVDFGRDMVVLVTATEICFGGVEIEAIERTGDDLLVSYADAASSLCLCVQPELSFHAVRVTRSAGEPSFMVRITPPLCP